MAKKSLEFQQKTNMIHWFKGWNDKRCKEKENKTTLYNFEDKKGGLLTDYNFLKKNKVICNNISTPQN